MTILYHNRTTTVLSDWVTSIGGLTSLFGGLVASRRRIQARNRSAEIYSDLIEHADEHILADLGYSRSDLFRMRAELYE